LTFIRLALATRFGVAPHIGIYLPGVGNMFGGCTSHWHLFTRCWQHARWLRLALVFLYSPDVGNTLRGCAFQPDASNTLVGYAHMLTLAFVPFVPSISNTLRGYTLCCESQQSSMLPTILRLPRRLRFTASILSTAPRLWLDIFRLDADDLMPR
jgi:hypothetical protein